ncbi:MAG: hypothetical protein AAFR55_07795 [Pseudomonadota bacterium]
MLTRIITVLIAAASAIVLVVLALANRHDARLVLDPFNREQPALEVTMPFFLFMMAALILGVAVGGMSTWFSQGKWRKAARQRTQEAMRWRGEAERLTRERDGQVAAARAFAQQTPRDNRPGTPAVAIASGR